MLRAAHTLRFAAAPTFAVLALLTSGFGRGAGADPLCLHAAAPLGGMDLMYGLMAGFHAVPWLRLIARYR